MASLIHFLTVAFPQRRSFAIESDKPYVLRTRFRKVVSIAETHSTEDLLAFVVRNVR